MGRSIHNVYHSGDGLCRPVDLGRVRERGKREDGVETGGRWGGREGGREEGRKGGRVEPLYHFENSTGVVWSASHCLQVDQLISLVVEARGEHMVGGISEPCCGQQTRDLHPLVFGS